MSLDNRVVVITGATGTLGRVVARRMAEEGARLALFGRNLESLERLSRGLDLPRERVLIGAYDLRDAATAAQAADLVFGTFDRADVLLHFVGGWIAGKTVSEVPAGDVSTMLHQHLWSTLHVAQAFVPRMVAAGWGRIVAISSPSAANPPVKGVAYSMAKAAEETLMVTLAEELKDSGVTANVLRVQAIQAQPAPGSRAITPEEIAATILYLCSEEGRIVNGARIPLYGAP
jgi:NAD(P)-dependent dehydrogenase (short-subunit alcohol dehydrogenase family)